MRWRRSCASVVLGAILAACQARPSDSVRSTTAPPTSLPSPTELVATAEPSPSPLPSGVAGAFAITLTDPEGRYPLEVTVLDRTGLVQSVESFIREDMPEGLGAAPRPTTGLEYTWVTGACDKKATLTFEPADITDTDQDTFRLSNVVEERVGECFLLGVTRALRLKASAPIQAARVSVLAGAKSSYRLMFDHFADKYPTEFELLDMTGLVTGLAHPTKLGDHSGLTDVVPPDAGLVYWPGPSTCTYRIAMVFERTEEARYRLRVWFDTDWRGFDCGLSGAGRWVSIRLREPVSARSVREVVQGS
jgi:hypothetical protein